MEDLRSKESLILKLNNLQFYKKVCTLKKQIETEDYNLKSLRKKGYAISNIIYNDYKYGISLNDNIYILCGINKNRYDIGSIALGYKDKDECFFLIEFLNEYNYKIKLNKRKIILCSPTFNKIYQDKTILYYNYIIHEPNSEEIEKYQNLFSKIELLKNNFEDDNSNILKLIK